jgi:pSer/pThr/pTyr-binding forkhead associated (FHA) protein
MADPIPCPHCGSENDPSAAFCHVCTYQFGVGVNPAADKKCPRCGSQVPMQFDFCPVCGLDQRIRLPRPSTAALSVRDAYGNEIPATGRPPSHTPTAPPDAGYRAPSAGAVPAPQPAFAPTMHQGAPRPVAPAGAPAMGHAFPGARPPEPLPQAPSGPFGAPMYPPAPPAPPPYAAPPTYAALPAHAPPAYAPPGYPAPGGYAPGYPGPAFAPAPAPMWLALVGRDGSEKQNFPLDAGQLHVGRTQGEIRFAQDQFVSPLHVRITKVEGGIHLTDLASRNGVYVRIGNSELVYPGDLFLLGHQLLRLENLPTRTDDGSPDGEGVRGFGTPLEPAWGRISLVGVGDVVADSYCLRGTQVVFGRESGDVLFPHDAFLSRQHARLRMELRAGAMSVVLEDLGSANGTYLRMRGQAMLHAGDMFRVGDQILRVRVP